MIDWLLAVAETGGGSPAGWVTGGAAILGAVVGGAATGFATYRIEKSRQQFSISAEERVRTYEYRRELRAAQAVARLLYIELARFGGMVTPSLEKRTKWWDQENHLVRSELSGDDQKLLVQYLTAQEFVAVMHAHVSMDGIRALRDVLVEQGVEEPLEDRAIEFLRKAIGQLNGGMEALGRFANSDDGHLGSRTDGL